MACRLCYFRTSVIAAYDEVGASVVLANDAVPDGFSRTAHAHGQRQHGKLYRAVRIFREQQLIAANPGEVIYVTRFGDSHGRMKQ